MKYVLLLVASLVLLSCREKQVSHDPNQVITVRDTNVVVEKMDSTGKWIPFENDTTFIETLSRRDTVYIHDTMVDYPEGQILIVAGGELHPIEPKPIHDTIYRTKVVHDTVYTAFQLPPDDHYWPNFPDNLPKSIWDTITLNGIKFYIRKDWGKTIYLNQQP